MAGDFGTGVKRGGVGLLNMIQEFQGYPGVRPNMDIMGGLPQQGSDFATLPDPTTARGRILQGVGEQVPMMSLLAPLALATGGGGLAVDSVLNMLGATAGETAREHGAGPMGQFAADAAGSITPAALGKRLATSGARRATGDAIEHLKHQGKHKLRAMRGMHDESTNITTKHQRMARTKGSGTAEDLRQLVQEAAGISYLDDASDAMRPTAFRTRGPGAGQSLQPDLFKGSRVAEYDLPPEMAARFNELGVPTPKIIETNDPAKFHAAIAKAKASTTFGPSVHVYEPEEYAGMRLFLTEDGTAGVALKPGGGPNEDQLDMISGFNTVGGPHKGIVPYLLAMAESEGGSVGDAFNIVDKMGRGGLPRIYGDAGLDMYKYDQWDPQYKPDDWDDALLGTPDVVYMKQAEAQRPLPRPSFNPGASVAPTLARAGVMAPDRQRRNDDGTISGLPPFDRPF